MAWMATCISSDSVYRHWRIRQQCMSSNSTALTYWRNRLMRLWTWTMNSLRHANTYSGSVGVGKRDNWLVGWQNSWLGKKQQLGQFFGSYQQEKLAKHGSCLRGQFCCNLPCYFPCNRLYIRFVACNVLGAEH